MTRTKKEPVVHLDFLGNALSMGDAVIYTDSYSVSLGEGRITKMSPKTVHVSGCRKYSKDLIKVPKETLLTRLLTGETK